MGRFHAGDTGICRITRGDIIKLDDCRCHSVTIGHLRFRAVDFGGSIRLNEFLQRKLVSSDRLERNQRTAIAAAAGILARDAHVAILPVRSRAIQTALDLRISEWNSDAPLVMAAGAAKSLNEKGSCELMPRHRESRA